MKITKRSLTLLLLSIIIPPLLGKYNLFGIELINKLIYYGLPIIYFISFLIDTIKSKSFKSIFKFNILSIPIIIFILSLTISIIFGININFNTFTNFIFYIYLIGYIYTLYIYSFNKEQLKIIFKAIILIFTLICTLGILQYIFKIDLIERGIYKYPGAIGRITSTMSISTILDKYITLNLLLLMYVTYKLKKSNWKLALIMILGVIALALTYSRAGTLCFYFVSVVFIVIYIYKKQFKNLLLIILMLITLYLVPGQNFLLSSTVSHVNNTINETLEKINLEKLAPINNAIAKIFIKGDSIKGDASLNSRDIYMKIAMQIIKEYPITGIGIGNYNYIYKYQNVNDYLENDIEIPNTYLFPHNLYYHFTAETGIIGFISLFIILIITLLKSFKNHKIVSILFFVVFLLINTTESILYMKDIAIWFIITYSLFMKNPYDVK